jgi:hypothetical protein
LPYSVLRCSFRCLFRVIRRGGAIDQLQSLTVHATACAQYLSLAFTSSGLSPAAIQSRTHEFIIHPIANEGSVVIVCSQEKRSGMVSKRFLWTKGNDIC